MTLFFINKFTDSLDINTFIKYGKYPFWQIFQDMTQKENLRWGLPDSLGYSDWSLGKPKQTDITELNTEEEREIQKQQQETPGHPSPVFSKIMKLAWELENYLRPSRGVEGEDL